MDQTQEPLKHHHQSPEEEEHHETGASKMFRKVKAKAKKFKNSLTKQDQSHDQPDHDMVEEDDGDGEHEPEVIGAPVKSSVTGQPESLNHPREANEEIIPPGTKVFPVVSSDYTKPIEPVPSKDVSYGYEVPSHSVRTRDVLDKEEKKDEPIHHPLSELPDREERRETHHEGLNTPVSLLSATEDVTETFAPGGKDEYLGGQRKVNFETPNKLEDGSAFTGEGFEYRSGISDFQSKGTDPTKEGSGEADIAESLSKMQVSDDYPNQKSELEFEGDSSTRSKESQEAVLGEDSPARSAGESGAEMGKEYSARSYESDISKGSPTRSHEFDMKIESAIDKNSPSRSHEFDLQTESKIDNTSPTAFGSESGAELGKEFPTERHEYDQKPESERNEYPPMEFGDGVGAPVVGNFPVTSLKSESDIRKDSPTEFGGKSGDAFSAKGSHGYSEETKLGSDLATGTHEHFSPELSRPKERDEFEETRDDFEETTQEINKISPTEYGDGGGAPAGGNFPVRSHEMGLKNESEIYKDSPAGFGAKPEEVFPEKRSHGHSEETENYFPERSDDVKVETELGSDLSTGTHEQFTPELSRPIERDDFEEKKQDTKPSTYTEQFTAATSAIAARLGYSGETPVKDETQVADEKWTPVDGKNRETESTVTTKLPFSGGGSGVEETEHVEDKGGSAKDYLSEKLTPGEEDKALSEVLTDKLKIGGEEEKKEMEVKVEKIPTKESESETVAEEEKAEVGMVGMIKGWFGGGATEEVKPKSPHSVQESSQSLDTTVGTKELSDISGNELGETGGRGGIVPVHKEV